VETAIAEIEQGMRDRGFDPPSPRPRPAGKTKSKANTKAKTKGKAEAKDGVQRD